MFTPAAYEPGKIIYVFYFDSVGININPPLGQKMIEYFSAFLGTHPRPMGDIINRGVKNNFIQIIIIAGTLGLGQHQKNIRHPGLYIIQG